VIDISKKFKCDGCGKMEDISNLRITEIGWICKSDCYPLYAEINIARNKAKIKSLEEEYESKKRSLEDDIETKIRNLKKDRTWTKVFMKIEQKSR